MLNQSIQLDESSQTEEHKFTPIHSLQDGRDARG